MRPITYNGRTGITAEYERRRLDVRRPAIVTDDATRRLVDHLGIELDRLDEWLAAETDRSSDAVLFASVELDVAVTNDAGMDALEHIATDIAEVRRVVAALRERVDVLLGTRPYSPGMEFGL